MKKIVAKETYRGAKVQFIHNDPKFKKGDEVIVYSDISELYEKITLTKVTKVRRHAKDIGYCWGCNRGKTIKFDAYSYVWDNTINENRIVDPIKHLNKYIELVNSLRKRVAENNKLSRIREILYED